MSTTTIGTSTFPNKSSTRVGEGSYVSDIDKGIHLNHRGLDPALFQKPMYKHVHRLDWSAAFWQVLFARTGVIKARIMHHVLQSERGNPSNGCLPLVSRGFKFQNSTDLECEYEVGRPCSMPESQLVNLVVWDAVSAAAILLSLPNLPSHEELSFPRSEADTLHMLCSCHRAILLFESWTIYSR
jgi:hypothetical protein